MSTEEQILEEYRSLRAVIQQCVGHNVKIFVFGVTVSAATFGYIASAGSGDIVNWALLVAGIVDILCVYAIIGQTYHFFQIAAYIKLFIEPVIPGLNWETKWATLRQKGRDRLNPVWRLNELFFYLLLLQGVAAAYLIWFLFKENTNCWIWVVCSGLFIVQLVICGVALCAAMNSERHAKLWSSALPGNE